MIDVESYLCSQSVDVTSDKYLSRSCWYITEAAVRIGMLKEGLL